MIVAAFFAGLIVGAWLTLGAVFLAVCLVVYVRTWGTMEAKAMKQAEDIIVRGRL